MELNRIYVAGMLEENCQTSCSHDGQHPYHMFFKNQCGHRHLTISGALRCLKRLERKFSDNSYDDWAHFGQVFATLPCGHYRKFSIQEQGKLDELTYVD
jgi:hypothetical protein